MNKNSRNTLYIHIVCSIACFLLSAVGKHFRKEVKLMEIERKFLIDGFPDLQELRREKMYQGYLCSSPVVRIRSTQTHSSQEFVLCFKGKGTLAREEIELPISEDIFVRLKALLPMPLVQKDHRVYSLEGGHLLECNLVDEGEQTQFYYAEVEFSTVEEANAFVPPAFLGREVTWEPEYSMSHYWSRKLAKRQENTEE